MRAATQMNVATKDQNADFWYHMRSPATIAIMTENTTKAAFLVLRRSESHQPERGPVLHRSTSSITLTVNPTKKKNHIPETLASHYVVVSISREVVLEPVEF